MYPFYCPKELGASTSNAPVVEGIRRSGQPHLLRTVLGVYAYLANDYYLLRALQAKGKEGESGWYHYFYLASCSAI